MSIKTSPSKTSPVSTIISSQTQPLPAAASAATSGKDHQPAAAQSTAVPVAADTKSQELKAQIEELASADSARRAAAATALGRLGDVAAAPALIAALGDADADVARDAAASLGRLGDAAAVEPLIAVLDNRDGYFHTVARAAASHSLGQLGDLRAVVPLLNAIRSPISEISAEAIRALASLPDPRSVPALLEVVRNERNFYLAPARRAAILGLAQIGGEQAACELRFVAANQWEDAAIRVAAVEAIGEGAAVSA